MMSKNLKHDSLSKKVLLSVLAAGVMSTCVMGSALARDVYDDRKEVVGSKIITDLNINNPVGQHTYFMGNNIYIYLKNGTGSKLTIKDSTIKNTKASIGNNPYHGLYGGAVFLKGTVTFENTLFENNVLEGLSERSIISGAAVYADAAINTGIRNDGEPNFIITKDMIYSGNNIISNSANTWYDLWGAVGQSSGGFLFLDRDSVAGFDISAGKTLTIGEKGSSGNMDSIASSIPFDKNKKLAVINKNGDGTLQINSDFNKYYGSVNVNAGTLNLDQNWTARNTVTVAENAKLNTKDITLVKLLDGLDFKKTYGTEIKTDDVDNYIYRPKTAVDYTSKLEHGGSIDNSTITGSITTAKGSTLTAKNIVVNAGSIKAAGNVVADSLEVNDGKVELNGYTDTEYDIINKLYAKKTSAIILSGGTLKADKLQELTKGSAEKAIQLIGDGVISTLSDQVFTNAAGANQKTAGEVVLTAIDFQGGTLSLNDAEYTLAYAKDAASKVDPTSVVMTGKLAGNVDNKINVDEASKIGDNVALDKVTAETTGSLLVGSKNISATKVEDIEVKDKVQNGFAVASLNLGQDAQGVIITNNKEVTLGGSQGGSVLTVNGDEKKTVTVVVGTNTILDGASSTAGTLNIGNSIATADTNYKLNAKVVINKDSKLNVKGKTEITDQIILNAGKLNAAQGQLITNKLAVQDDSALLGEVKANSLEGENGKTLAIGDNDNAGKLTVEKATLNGATLFLDPAWKDGATIGDASGFAVTDVSTALDGAYVAGQNSKLAFGADLQAAEEKFAKTGFAWGGDDEEISAAAYIAKSVDLGTVGSIIVDGSLTAAPTATAGEVSFADNSLLMVDGTQAVQEAVIKNVASANIDGGSGLYIDEAKKGETYHILAGTTDGWEDEAVESNNSLLKFTNANVAGEYAVTASTASVKDVFEGQVIAPNAYDATLNAKNDGDADYDFITAAADSKVNGSYDAQVSALNSAAALSELAGVEHGTYSASNLLTDAVSEHMSLANAKEHDSDIWAKYIHTKEDVDGLAIANFGADYDAQYNGIVVGADLYKNGKATIGAALTYVDGNINGNTLAARTKNDATYYGASIYGGIQNEDSAVIGDISYLHGKNDITQYNSGKTLTADAKSDAFSIGVRAEKSLKAGVGKFVPYAGLRYMHLGTGNYTNSIGMSYDGDDMNLWLLPVGVKYSADVKTGSWTIRPIAEVGYVWNMGDRDATQTVSLNGASDGFGYDVTDSGSYIGRFMIEAEKANVTYGLGYEYQKGDSVKANRWMANLNWSF